MVRKHPVIRTKTGNTCAVCDEPETHIVFHKTKRQVHAACKECALHYMGPILDLMERNARKRVAVNNWCVKCPGTYHSRHDNQCHRCVSLLEMRFPPNFPLNTQIAKLCCVAKMDDVVLCVNEACGEAMFFNNMLGNYVCCGACRTTWCMQCMVSPYHNNKTCIQHEADEQKTENGQAIRSLVEEGALKYCPACASPVIKNNGCNKIWCAGCGTKWCWLCGAGNIDYDHYNAFGETPCANRLWEGVNVDL